MLDVETKDDPKQEDSDINDLDDMAAFIPDKKTDANEFGQEQETDKTFDQKDGDNLMDDKKMDDDNLTE